MADHKVHLAEDFQPHRGGLEDIAWQAYCEDCSWASRWVHSDEYTEQGDPAQLAHDKALRLGEEHEREERL